MKDSLQTNQPQQLTKNELLRNVAENLLEDPIADLEGIAAELKANPNKLLHYAAIDEVSERLDKVKGDIEGIFLAINTLERFYTH